MRQQTFKLVALDIDGTVLDSSGHVSRRLKRALALLARRDVRTVLCTGRRWRTTLPVMGEIENAHALAVCCGGALIKDGTDNRTYHAIPLPRRAARHVAEAMRGKDLVPFILLDRDAGERELLISDLDRAHAADLPYVKSNEEFVEYYPGEFPKLAEPVLVVYTMDEVRRVSAAQQPLQRKLAGESTLTAMHQGRYGAAQWALEAHGIRATKWNALRWLLKRWRVPARQVVAIGDDVNDIPMLRAAGMSFAMGNAVPAVKRVASRTTTSNDEDGVVEALCSVFGMQA